MAQQFVQETPDQALVRAQAAASAKRFGEAGGICADLLAKLPEHEGALALLGIIRAHTGQPEKAVELLERAVRHQPGIAAWHSNLCSLYRTLNLMQDALAAGQ